MAMRAPFESRWLLAAASRLVPRPLRADWLREWEAEVWWWLNSRPHARSMGTRMRLAAHCWGGFADARCLRSESQNPPTPGSAWFRTPGACMAALVLPIAVVVAAAEREPPVGGALAVNDQMPVITERRPPGEADLL